MAHTQLKIDPDLIHFLRKHNLEDLRLKFAQEHIQLKHLISAEDGDLDELFKSLGLKVSEKIRVKHALKELHSGEQTTDVIVNNTSIVNIKANTLIESKQQEKLRDVSISAVILGPSQCGKSSIVIRLIKNKFATDQFPTIGATFLTNSYPIGVDAMAKLEIWDTAGQERFRSLAPLYYRGKYAIIIVYDITDAASFSDAKTWVDEVMNNAIGYNKILLIGNKLDLEDQRQVTTSLGMAFAAKYAMSFIEVSAKTATNMDVFEDWICAQGKQKSLTTSNEPAPIQLDKLVAVEKNKPRKNKKCC